MSIYISGDVSKCANKECPLHRDCYGFRAVSRNPDRQVYTAFVYDEVKGCSAFVKLTAEEKEELDEMSSP